MFLLFLIVRINQLNSFFTSVDRNWDNIIEKGSWENLRLLEGETKKCKLIGHKFIIKIN